MLDEQLLIKYRRQKLVNLVREADALWGNSDQEFLEEYIAEGMKEWSNDLQSAIRSFEFYKKQVMELREAKNGRQLV